MSMFSSLRATAEERATQDLSRMKIKDAFQTLMAEAGSRYIAVSKVKFTKGATEITVGPALIAGMFLKTADIYGTSSELSNFVNLMYKNSKKLNFVDSNLPWFLSDFERLTFHGQPDELVDGFQSFGRSLRQAAKPMPQPA